MFPVVHPGWCTNCVLGDLLGACWTVCMYLSRNPSPIEQERAKKLATTWKSACPHLPDTTAGQPRGLLWPQQRHTSAQRPRPQPTKEMASKLKKEVSAGRVKRASTSRRFSPR